MKIVITTSILLALSAGAAVGQQYPTIVGNWYEPDYGPSDCGKPLAVSIKPMEMIAIEEFCSFGTVKREGWKVTWTGQCSLGGRDPREMTVVAVEEEGKLRIDWSDGTYIPDLRRCPK